MSHIRSRFTRPATDAVVRYTSSLLFDYRLYPQDIAGSIAHVKMLASCAIIDKDEAVQIENGLATIKKELDDNTFVFKPELEDIHMAIESRLFELIGEVAGKLHTGRSRNDQVALDMRMYLKESMQKIARGLVDLEQAIVEKASQNIDTLMPGYTHLQHAQPVLFAHHMLAYFEMLERDRARLADCFSRTDVMPLGSGALAGTDFEIDRQQVANLLGFSRLSANSLDAVCDRDFIIEFEAMASILMMHLSRLGEEIVVWSSSEFGFIELDETYSTGSSIMPQKKNPDVAELGRAKTGRIYGHLISILTVMKSLPLSYNRDLQEDKEAVFDTVDTLEGSLEVFTGMVSTLTVNKAKLLEAARDGYILATDVADYLVKKGLTFRQAHAVTGKLVNFAASKSKPLEELELDDFRRFSPLFESDVLSINLETSVMSRDLPGGTSPNQITRALDEARVRLENAKGNKI